MKSFILIFIFCLPNLICFAQNEYIQNNNQHQIGEIYELRDTDWEKIGPIAFLEMLKSDLQTFPYFIIWNRPPCGWVKEQHVEKLILLVQSQELANSVISSVSSYRPSTKSTVGNQAMFLIEGFRKGCYPPGQLSPGYQESEVKEMQKWWFNYKKSNKSMYQMK